MHARIGTERRERLPPTQLARLSVPLVERITVADFVNANQMYNIQGIGILKDIWYYDRLHFIQIYITNKCIFRSLRDKLLN